MGRRDGRGGEYLRSAVRAPCPLQTSSAPAKQKYIIFSSSLPLPGATGPRGSRCAKKTQWINPLSLPQLFTELKRKLQVKAPPFIDKPLTPSSPPPSSPAPSSPPIGETFTLSFYITQVLYESLYIVIISCWFVNFS